MLHLAEMIIESAGAREVMMGAREVRYYVYIRASLSLPRMEGFGDHYLSTH